MISSKHLIQFYHDIALIVCLVIWLVCITVYANITNTGGLFLVASFGILLISSVSIFLRIKLIIPETLVHVYVSILIAIFIDERLSWFHITSEIIQFVARR